MTYDPEKLPSTLGARAALNAAHCAIIGSKGKTRNETEIDRSVLDEMGRVLAHCLIRDAHIGATSRAVQAIRDRADGEERSSIDSPRVVVILRQVADEIEAKS